MAVFPDEDRESYPDMFKLPEGCYEVALYCRKQGCTAFGRLARRRPLQIVHQAAPSSGQLHLSASWAVPAGHVGLVCDIGVAAQAARHRLRGGGGRPGRGGRLPGGGFQRGEVRPDTAGRHPDRRDRIQGISYA